MSRLNSNNIWCEKQNHPELVVQDLKDAFSLNDEECERVRLILLRRGVNKWLYARRKFIGLKHKTKTLLRNAQIIRETTKNSYTKQHHLILQEIHSEMQEICKMPRWVEWPKHIHHQRKKDEAEVIIEGKHC